jgi:dephospho-CoA kinase
MIVIGLTGSIAMGKSTIGAMMTNMGIPVHESDHAAHELLDIKSPARPALASAFPIYEFPQIYDRKTKAINRRELGALVFNNDEYREKLEGILHPLVQQSQTDFIREHTIKGRKVVCLDIPLLFETHADKRVDYTFVASAPYHVQQQRALSRPNMTEEKLQAILERQMPDKEKCIRADYVIKTGLGRAHSMKELKLALLDIKKKEGLIPVEEDEDKSFTPATLFS